MWIGIQLPKLLRIRIRNRSILPCVNRCKYVILELRENLSKFKNCVITGKEEKDCMYEQTGLGLFIFDENRYVSFL
jgi:hypothetical protein